MWNVNQEFRGDVTVVGNYTTIGVNYSHRDFENWMKCCAATKTYPHFHEPSFAGSLMKSIFSSDNLKRCFTRQGQTLVLEGKLGVGKSTTMLGILIKLDQLRKSISERKPTDPTISLETERIAKARNFPAPLWLHYLLSFLLPLFVFLVGSKQLWSEKAFKDCLVQENEDLCNDRSQEQQWQDVVVASMFFSADQQDEQLPYKVLMLLLKELVDKIPGSIEHVRDLYMKNRNSTPAPEAIADTLIAVLGKESKACIFLDALDEYYGDLPVLLEQLKRVQEQSKIGIIMTDRIDTRKQQWIYRFPHAHSQILRAYEADVQAFMEIRLSSQGNISEQYAWARDRTVRNKVKGVISLASGGIFLLVRLNVDFVCTARGEEDIASDLDTIKTMIHDDGSDTDKYHTNVIMEVYGRNIDRVLKQSDTRNSQDALLTLAFMRDAVRPLAIHELLELLSVQVLQSKLSKRSVPLWITIQHCCQGLIEKNEHGIVRYLHQSLRKYLVSPDGLWKVPAKNEELGKRCAAYLTFDFCPQGVCRDPESLKLRLQEWPFMHYAARYWKDHLKILEKAKEREITDEDYSAGSFHAVALEFLKNDTHVESAFQIRMLSDTLFQLSQRQALSSAIYHRRIFLVIETGRCLISPFVPNQTVGLHAACLFGFRTLVDRLLITRLPQILDCRSSNGRAPLHYATEGGHAQVVEMLIKAGADPNCQDAQGNTPFILANTLDFNEVTAVFMKLGDRVNVNAQTRFTLNRKVRRIEVEFLERGGVSAFSRIRKASIPLDRHTQLHFAS